MDNDGFEAKSGHIRKLAAMAPDKLMDYLGGIHARLEQVAPGIAPQVHSAAVNAISYLNGKLPPQGAGLAQDAEPVISDHDKEHWLGLHKIINDPVSIFDHVEQGTLNHEHVSALSAVYPDLRQEMAQKAALHLGALRQKGTELPYEKRQMLSLLMGEPLDSTLTQPAMAAATMANRAAVTTTQGTMGNPVPASQRNGPKPPKRATQAQLEQFNKVDEMSATPLERRQLPKS